MNFEKLLKSHSLRATKARVSLLNLLSRQNRPLDVKDVFHELKVSGVKSDLATVYRILDRLVAHGLVKQVDFREGKLRYEIEGHHHHHLVCENCDQVTVVECDLLNTMQKDLSKNHHFLIKDHVLEFFGLCKNCRTLRS